MGLFDVGFAGYSAWRIVVGFTNSCSPVEKLHHCFFANGKKQDLYARLAAKRGAQAV